MYCESFEDIKYIDENEFWFARELQIALDYKKWQKFIIVINNAKTACEQSNFMVNYHFAQVDKMVDIGSKTSRNIIDYKLSRYACYLIVQNADPRKEIEKEKQKSLPKTGIKSNLLVK